MTFADRIRNAQNPQLAMLVLAEGIDAILADLDAAPASDTWGSWDVNDGGPAGDASGSVSNDDGRATQRPVVDNSAAIAAAEAQLVTESDPETRQALEARLRLLKDDGASIDLNPPAGARATEQQVADGVVTVLPPPDAQRVQSRRGLAKLHNLWEYSTLGEQEFVAAFEKGGPLWLYHTARDEVLSMPVALRRLFIEDIHVDSPLTAHEVARDILKDSDATGTRSSSETLLLEA